MTIKQAYQILGLPAGAHMHEIKKRYRKLMLQVHPDVRVRSPKTYAYSAQEINAAYAILKEKISGGMTGDIHHNCHDQSCRKKGNPNAAWDAPANENAYREREILQHVEDHDGTILGLFSIASGKYMWTMEEEFSLFLLSLYQCGKQLLDEIDALPPRKEPSENRSRFHAELTYLLAQQFIPQTALLEELAKKETADPEGNRVFYIPSMLESSNKAVSLKPGETLYPVTVRQHKLYLKNQADQVLGYLSFLDDRLYYIVIPLFEQKAVRLKIRATEKQPEKGKKADYQNLRLWIKLSGRNDSQLPENLNLRIKELLEKYKRL